MLTWLLEASSFTMRPALTHGWERLLGDAALIRLTESQQMVFKAPSIPSFINTLSQIKGSMFVLIAWWNIELSEVEVLSGVLQACRKIA